MAPWFWPVSRLRVTGRALSKLLPCPGARKSRTTKPQSQAIIPMPQGTKMTGSRKRMPRYRWTRQTRVPLFSKEYRDLPTSARRMAMLLRWLQWQLLRHRQKPARAVEKVTAPNGDAALRVTKRYVSLLIQLCNACGLRYARSLSNKRRRGKDGTVVTVEATGDPSMVPPSRGSGGGSRPGVHRRTQKRNMVQEEGAVSHDVSSRNENLANVLATLPQSRPTEAVPSYVPDPADAVPHPVVMAAAAAAADSRLALPNGGLPDLSGAPATTTMLPTTVPATAPTPEYMTRPAVPAPTPGKNDYDAKSLDALLSNTLLPTSHEQTPIFAALTHSPNMSTAPVKKGDMAFSLPMDSMAVSASVTPTDATIGMLPNSDAHHYPDMFSGLNHATVSQQET